LLTLRPTIQRLGKSIDITHLDVLVCRKACVAQSAWTSELAGPTNRIGFRDAIQPYTFDGRTIRENPGLSEIR
jgi:hypothetical protein